MKKLIAVALLCAVVAGGAFARGARDQEYADIMDFPSRPVTAMVAWAAGGGADMVFRAMAEVFPRYANGQPLLIVNRGEAAGVPGIMDFRMNASADGYNVMQWNAAHVIRTHMDTAPFTGTEFVSICQIVIANNYLLVPADAPWQTLQEFIADARANPGQITVGNAGTGGGNHFAALILEREEGIQFRHVPFAGGGPAVTGLLTGDVMATMAVPPEGAANIAAGQLRILGLFGNERMGAFPDVPTGIEQGVNFAMDHWRGIVAPVGIPEDRRQRLEDIFRQVVTSPEFAQRMEAMGAIPAFTDGRTFAAQVEADDRMFLEIIRANRMGNIHN